MLTYTPPVVKSEFLAFRATPEERHTLTRYAARRRAPTLSAAVRLLIQEFAAVEPTTGRPRKVQPLEHTAEHR